MSNTRRKAVDVYWHTLDPRPALFEGRLEQLVAALKEQEAMLWEAQLRYNPESIQSSYSDVAVHWASASLSERVLQEKLRVWEDEIGPLYHSSSDVRAQARQDFVVEQGLRHRLQMARAIVLSRMHPAVVYFEIPRRYEDPVRGYRYGIGKDEYALV